MCACLEHSLLLLLLAQSSCCHNQACNKGDDTCGVASVAVSASVVIVSPEDASPLLQ